MAGVPRAGSRTALFSITAGLALMFLVGPLLKLVLGADPHALARVRRPHGPRRNRAQRDGSDVGNRAGTIVGTPLGFLLARRDFSGRTIVEALTDLPVVAPHRIAGVALLFVFGRRFFVGRAFELFGVHFGGAVLGIVIAMLFVSAPFLINAARDGFRAVDPRLESVARTLGRGPWAAFFGVTLPLARGALVSGAVTMWARALSEFGAMVVLACYPMTAPVLIYDRFEGYGLSAAQPVAAAVVIIALILFAALHTSTCARPWAEEKPDHRPRLVIAPRGQARTGCFMTVASSVNLYGSQGAS
jgi:molybdate/tungstate transport system permease protein